MHILFYRYHPVRIANAGNLRPGRELQINVRIIWCQWGSSTTKIDDVNWRYCLDETNYTGGGYSKRRHSLAPFHNPSVYLFWNFYLSNFIFFSFLSHLLLLLGSLGGEITCPGECPLTGLGFFYTPRQFRHYFYSPHSSGNWTLRICTPHTLPLSLPPLSN